MLIDDVSNGSTPSQPILDISSLDKSFGEKIPRWQCNRAIYHISFRLADSVPQSVRVGWLRERAWLLEHIKEQGDDISEEVHRKLQYLYSEHVEKYLDRGCGKCYLYKPEIANLVV